MMFTWGGGWHRESHLGAGTNNQVLRTSNPDIRPVNHHVRHYYLAVQNLEPFAIRHPNVLELLASHFGLQPSLSSLYPRLLSLDTRRMRLQMCIPRLGPPQRHLDRSNIGHGPSRQMIYDRRSLAGQVPAHIR